MRRVSFIISAAIIIIVGILIVTNLPSSSKLSSTPKPSPTATLVDYLSYQGEQGKDALTILKSKASIEQDKSGLVTAINGRVADSSKHEYWAFYINGKLSDVGPSDYKTSSSDKIEWKIEKY